MSESGTFLYGRRAGAGHAGVSCGADESTSTTRVATTTVPVLTAAVLRATAVAALTAVPSARIVAARVPNLAGKCR